MAQVRYAFHVNSLGRFSHVAETHFLYLDEDVLYVQNSQVRSASTVVERLKLEPSITAVGRAPLLGLKWYTEGDLRKFQVRFMTNESYTWYTKAMSRYMPIQIWNAGSIETVLDKTANIDPRIIGPKSDCAQSEILSDSSTSAIQLSKTKQNQMLTATNTAKETVTNPLLDEPHKLLKPLIAPTPIMPMHGASVEHNKDTEAPKTPNTISQERLGSMLASFLKDDSNIHLCEAVERYWTDAGMKCP